MLNSTSTAKADRKQKQIERKKIMSDTNTKPGNKPAMARVSTAGVVTFQLQDNIPMPASNRGPKGIGLSKTLRESKQGQSFLIPEGSKSTARTTGHNLGIAVRFSEGPETDKEGKPVKDAAGNVLFRVWNNGPVQRRNKPAVAATVETEATAS